jgi:hypothetical protein
MAAREPKAVETVAHGNYVQKVGTLWHLRLGTLFAMKLSGPEGHFLNCVRN